MSSKKKFLVVEDDPGGGISFMSKPAEGAAILAAVKGIMGEE